MSRPPLFHLHLLLSSLLLLLAVPACATFANISRVRGCYDRNNGSTVQCYSGQNVTIFLTSSILPQCVSTNLSVLVGERWTCQYPAITVTGAVSCLVPDLPFDALNQTLPVRVGCGNESSPWFVGLQSWGNSLSLECRAVLPTTPTTPPAAV